MNCIEGRKHPPLRIDREVDEDLLAEPDKYEKSGLSQDSKATDTSREVEVLVNIRAFVPTVLSVMCTPLPNNVRSKVVRSLCEAWRVRCKGSATASAVDAWINALSKRIAPVLQQKLKGAKCQSAAQRARANSATFRCRFVWLQESQVRQYPRLSRRP